MAANVQLVADSKTKSKLYLLYLGRSDGKSEIAVKKGATESNMPTPEQLRKVKLGNGLYTFYQEIPINDPKHMDWRRKLGGLIAKEAHRQLKQKGELPASGPFSQSEIQMEEFCLADFPENYRLWEHRRSANLDNPNAPSRNDRRDAYLYGHPLGRKKRFRSPADFYYHLEWLAFDPEGDPENCRCKICTPDEVIKAGEDMRQLQVKLLGTAEEKEQLKAKTLVSKAEPAVNLSTNAIDIPEAILQKSQKLEQAPVVTEKAPSIPDPAFKSIAIAPLSVAPTTSLAAKVADPIPLVQPKHLDQAADQQLNSFVYRVGELVWFSRDNGAVGLAAVIGRNRTVDTMGMDRRGYLLQPLSHPFRHPERLYIDNERRVVPWLAYSTPPCTHRSLQNSTQHYDNIRWEQLVNDTSGDAEVDGSIFAAKAVDSTFTLLQMLPPSGVPTMEVDYNGIYFGGELVWVGEAVRLHENSSQNKARGILIVSRVIERMHTARRPSEVFLIGDSYELRTTPHNPSRPHPPNRYLPQKVQEDLKFRNGPRIAQRREEMHWKFIEGQRRVPLYSVSGRWYESKAILPIIQGEGALQERIKTGDIPDVTDFLNIRGSSSLGEGQIGIKKADRNQAFSRSVPPDTVFQISFPDLQPQPANSAVPSSALGPNQPDRSVGGGERQFGFVDMDQMDEGGYPEAF